MARTASRTVLQTGMKNMETKLLLLHGFGLTFSRF